jgi:hypothetical protein
MAPPFSLLHDRPVDLVLAPGPSTRESAVEGGPEAVAAVPGQDHVGLLGADLADEDVAPADLAAVGLELDGAGL